MKTATVYAADVTYNVENAEHHLQPILKLSTYPRLPNITQEITSYIEQLLTADERAVCNMATD